MAALLRPMPVPVMSFIPVYFRRQLRRLGVWCCLSVVVACSSGTNHAGESAGDVQSGPSTEVVPSVRYARGFAFGAWDRWPTLEVFQPRGQGHPDTLRYGLFPAEVPAEVVEAFRARYPGAQTVQVPIQSMVALSATHVALAEALGAGDGILGVTQRTHLYSPGIRQAIEAGQVLEVAPGGNLNPEAALGLSPDLVMASVTGAADLAPYEVLQRAGIPVLVNAEWRESSPLGRAEWIRVMGALLGKQAQADSMFRRVESAYHQLRALVDTVAQRPVVFRGLGYQGVWYVPAGDSYAAGLMRDAGADYPWQDAPGQGSLPLDFEAVYPRAMAADFWLHAGAHTRLSELRAVDSRLARFPAVQRGRVYNPVRRMHPDGGNDYWETGTLRPDRVLADLIHIFHPERLPDHQLYYYLRLPDA